MTGNSNAVIERGEGPRRARASGCAWSATATPPVAPLPPRQRSRSRSDTSPTTGPKRATRDCWTRSSWSSRDPLAGRPRRLRARCASRSPPEIAERGLAGRVSAGGPIADVRGFWAEHDVAVLLSDDEGSPNALIEAAMLGRPLVGTDGGGTREVVAADGGILVSREPGEIAAALERLIDDRELRLRLGAGARRHALAEHDLEQAVAAHLAALHEALGDPIREG